MLQTALLSLLLCPSALAAAQNTPSAPPNQTLPQGQPQSASQTAEEPNATAPAPPAFAPGTNAAGAYAPTNAPAGPIRISGGVIAGNVLTKVDPIYPPELRAAGVEGAVVLAARVSKDGTVTALQPISGPPALCEAAMTAVRQWTYRPYVLNGQLVAVSTTITVNFRLDRKPAGGAPTP